MKKLTTFLLALLVAHSAWAYDFMVDNIYYDITSDSTVEVTYKTNYYTSTPEYTGSITIPSTAVYSTVTYDVTSIGGNTFFNCSSLTSVTIPSSVTSIGGSAFDGTAWYNSQPDGMLYLDNWVIDYKGTMPANTSITINDGTVRIAGDAFYGCTGLTSVTIPSSVTLIGQQAFRNCSGLTSITIPSSVTSIGGRAFYNCTGLTSITIPSSVTSIEYSAFYNCTGLTSITIPSSVTSIGGYAFYGCNILSNINIPESVTNIGEYAFCNCTNLTSISIPESVTTIEQCAFRYCSGLTSVNIPEGLTTIEGFVFNGCSSLTAIDIPDSVTFIGEQAFFNCSGITSITIPSTVTTIQWYAFGNCSSLSSIYALPVLPVDLSSSPSTFQNVNKITCTLYVPEGSLTYYSSVDQWQDFLFKEEIPITGVDDINLNNLNIHTQGTNIIIENAQNNPISVYNINGEKICNVLNATSMETINVTQTGVYIVIVGSKTKKIVLNNSL